MAGDIIWYELMTSDPDAAQTFYGAVLGWSFRDSGQSTMDYRQFTKDDQFVGGVMALPPGAAKMGMRPGWFFYVSVDDVDAAAARIVADGGAMHMPVIDIPGVGRFAFVADPHGANFYVMTPTGEGPATSHRRDRIGHGGWHELHTTDAAAAFQFYSSHFGWGESGSFDMGAMRLYRLFDVGAVQAGGMMNDGSLGAPAWLIYFTVDDIDAAAARVTAAGGRILFGPSAVPDGSWIVNAVDPQGGMFALVRVKGLAAQAVGAATE